MNAKASDDQKGGKEQIPKFFNSSRDQKNDEVLGNYKLDLKSPAFVPSTVQAAQPDDISAKLQGITRASTDPGKRRKKQPVEEDPQAKLTTSIPMEMKTLNAQVQLPETQLNDGPKV